MLINSRSVVFLLAFSISIITVSFLSLVKETPFSAFMVVGALSFASSFLLIYVTFEFLIFKEMNSIHQKLEELGAKDFKFNTKGSSYPIRTKQFNKELVQYAAQKNTEIDELKKRAVFRREFIADISHELKTPLFAAQGFILTLRDGAVEDIDVRDKFLKKASKSLDSLSVLVDDLLTLSQIEQGDITMYFEPFDIKRLTNDIFEQFETKAEKKSINFTLNSDEMDKVWVDADYNRIKQVLTNLIHNAIKYNPDFCEVSVNFFQEPENKRIKIQVQDDGTGISDEHLPRIFERFYRVEKSRSKKQGGTGLGLAIAKHIIGRHESTISVESKLTKGTTFTFYLKATEASEEQAHYSEKDDW